MLVSIITIIILFLGIGYCEVANIELKINGNAKLSKQTGMVITDVILNSFNNVEKDNSKINSFYQTILNSKIVLNNIYDSEITYQIKMKNLDSKKKVFKDLSYDKDFYDNEDITIELENLKINDIINENSELIFNIKYKYKQIKDNYDNTILNSIISFKFEDYES